MKSKRPSNRRKTSKDSSDKRPEYFKTTVAARLRDLKGTPHVCARKLRDFLLATFSESPSLAKLRDLTPLQMAIVEDYAARVHLGAADNIVRIPKEPGFIQLRGNRRQHSNTGTIYDLI